MKLLQDYYLRTSPRIHKIPLLESKRSPKICIAPQRDRYDTQHAARAKCWESCTHVKIRTAPQREWSDTHKATRGLREHMLDADEKWALKMTRAMFYQGLSHFFVEVYKVLRLPWKKAWGTRSVAPAARNHHVQNPKPRQPGVLSFEHLGQEFAWLCWRLILWAFMLCPSTEPYNHAAPRITCTI